MIDQVSLRLNLTDVEHSRLRELQVAFVDACNFIAGIVVTHRCWNRVALHHLVYASVRSQIPKLGSQMVSNAIYTVSRASRKIYQDPESHWKIDPKSPRPLPQLKFLPNHPVFFDRHTLSVREKMISIFSLDGRLQLKASIPEILKKKLNREKLRDIAMQINDDSCVLHFHFRIPENDKDYKTLDPTYQLNLPATKILASTTQ